MLGELPDVFLPASKEVHFFEQNYEAGESWYWEHFQGAQPNQRCGDITPFCLFHPDVPGRVYQHLPNARLIVLLSGPIEWAISQLFHAQRLGFEPLPVAEAFAAEHNRLATGDPYSFQKHSYVSRSHYLESWTVMKPFSPVSSG